MKKFVNIIATFILSITLLSVPVQAEINDVILEAELKSNNLTVMKLSTYEYAYDILELAEKSMSDDFKTVFVRSDINEDVYIYTLVPKDRQFLSIAEDAYRGDIESIQFWNEFTDGLRETSVLIQQHASQVTGSKYAIMILNPEDYEHFMWMAFDGEVIYDDVHDIDDTDKLFNKM